MELAIEEVCSYGDEHAHRAPGDPAWPHPNLPQHPTPSEFSAPCLSLDFALT